MMETKRKIGWITLGSILAFWSTQVYAQGTATETIGLRIDVQSSFNIEIVSEEPGEVQLGPILPGEGPVMQEVKVKVRTNAGRPYRVTHTVDQASEQGWVLPSDDLQLTVSDGLRGGRSEIKGFQPLTPGTTVLFSSGPRGRADEFTIKYRASTKQVRRAGLYRIRAVVEGNLL